MKRTLEEVNKKIKEIRKTNDIIITQYNGSKKPYEFKHLKCNTIFIRKTYMPSFFTTWNCPTCKSKKNYEIKEQEYKNELKEFNFELLENFIGFSKKYSYLHKLCGETSYLHAQRGKYLKCPKCKDGIRKQDIYQQKIDEIYGGNQYKIVTYINSNDLIVEHNCGYIKKSNMRNLQNKLKCPKCEGGHMYHTKESFKEAFRESMGKEYLLLEDFSHSGIPMLIKHTRCGKEYKAFSTHLLNGRKCRECTLDRLWGKRDNNFFLERFNRAPDSYEYELVSEYQGMMKPITLLHLNCGNEFTASAQNILSSGTRCRYCNISKGEKRIKHHLETLMLDFNEQQMFDDCYNPDTNMKLKFDFGLKINNEIVALIEYDGIQHFKILDYFGGEEKYKTQQYLDSIKNKYCNENSIPLLRIPYTEFEDIENIVDKFLNTAYFRTPFVKSLV